MIDFSPSPEQVELVEKARAFTKDWISPNAAKYDRSGEFPREICREAFNQGLMNPHVPAESGGHLAQVGHVFHLAGIQSKQSFYGYRTTGTR